MTTFTFEGQLYIITPDRKLYRVIFNGDLPMIEQVGWFEH